MKIKLWLAAFLLQVIISHISAAQGPVLISSDNSPQAQFAVAKIKNSLAGWGFKASVGDKGALVNNLAVYTIVLATFDDKNWSSTIPASVRETGSALKPEGFIIHRAANKGKITLFVVGKDAAGSMYGGLELAELIKTGGLNSVRDVTQNPHMMRRGIKMNIPLDARTPSYTDASDAGQQNIAEMWSMDFWKAHIDSLASYRFNFISLWSLHPFPSLIKVPAYPDIALNDVHRSTIHWEEYYSTRGTGLDGPEVTDHYEVVRKISIDEKIKFWQEVMRYGKERNIDFYIVTWNTFTNSTKGKYRITDDLNNPVTKDYFRKSVKQLFITYPDLVGIGLTTGENMPGADFEAKENWSFETYGQGVLDVVQEQPDRKITFIHRQHETGALDIAKKFGPLIAHKNINFVFSFKYAQAHVYSATKQPFHHEFVKDIQLAGNLKTLWTLRNDDVYYFRWGAPDFVRDFVKNIPTDPTAGFYFGSDQHIWGREFMDKYPAEKRPIELAKHWYQWMLWGRLGYNPDIDNSRFMNILENRYPEVQSEKLFEAWQAASMIYPLTTGFHWGALDFQWYIEGSKSRPEPAQTPSGFHDLNRFITLPPHKGTDFISIPDYVKMKTAGTSLQGTTPPQVASKINDNADRALSIIKDISSPANDELYKTIEDIKAMAYMGKYYAHKINAATEVALFRINNNPEHRQSMASELNLSAFYWRSYVSTALAQYKNPLWTNRVGYVDWRNLYQYVLKDITDNGGNINLPHMEVSPGGTVLEAESVRMANIVTGVEKRDFTGTGYALSNTADGKLTWSYNAEDHGYYIVEIRYLFNNSSPANSTLEVDHGSVGTITYWAAGSEDNWVVDKVRAKLTKGEHTISISLPQGVQVDHINVVKAWK